MTIASAPLHGGGMREGKHIFLKNGSVIFEGTMLLSVMSAIH